LNLKWDFLVSKFAFTFNLYRYIKWVAASTAISKCYKAMAARRAAAGRQRSICRLQARWKAGLCKLLNSIHAYVEGCFQPLKL
jgi:hypothetical protein